MFFLSFNSDMNDEVKIVLPFTIPFEYYLLIKLRLISPESD